MGFEAMLSAAFMSPRYIMIESPVPFIDLFSPNKTPTAGRDVGIAALGCDNLLLCSWDPPEHPSSPTNSPCLYKILTPPPFPVILRAHTLELGNIPEHMKEHTEYKQL